MGTLSWHSEFPSVNTFAFLSLLTLPVIDRHIFLISLHYPTLFFWNHLMRSEIKGLVDERFRWQFTDQATTEDVALWKVSRICLLMSETKVMGSGSLSSQHCKGVSIWQFTSFTALPHEPEYKQRVGIERIQCTKPASWNKFSYSWGRIISVSNFIIPI